MSVSLSHLLAILFFPSDRVSCSLSYMLLVVKDDLDLLTPPFTLLLFCTVVINMHYIPGSFSFSLWLESYIIFHNMLALIV